MSEHSASVRWGRVAEPADFVAKHYTRDHEWRFDGGAVVAASASPHIVHAPFSSPAAVDPEEAFVVSLASCHMLWFLASASKAGLVVDSYQDDATGVLEPDAAGRTAITRVTLRPRVVFRPAIDHARVIELHEQAHGACFIANSVRTTITIEAIDAGDAVIA